MTRTLAKVLHELPTWRHLNHELHPQSKYFVTKLFEQGMIIAPILQSPNKKLVYIPTLKCASSYFGKTLADDNNWQQITINEVDWTNQTVFGFLLHPRLRYAKGAATDMFDVGIENIVMTYVGARFWEYPPILGVHTVPITQVYKDVYHQVHWIPLDCEYIDYSKEIVELCKKHNEQITLPNRKENVSTEHQKAIYTKIEKLIAGPGESWYNMLYPEDIELYNRVTKK